MSCISHSLSPSQLVGVVVPLWGLSTNFIGKHSSSPSEESKVDIVCLLLHLHSLSLGVDYLHNGPLEQHECPDLWWENYSAHRSQPCVCLVKPIYKGLNVFSCSSLTVFKIIPFWYGFIEPVLPVISTTVCFSMNLSANPLLNLESLVREAMTKEAIFLPGSSELNSQSSSFFLNMS